MRPREKSREDLAWRQQLYPLHTHALSPSFLRICKPQSQVFRYLCASRPCKIPACHRTQQPALVQSTLPPSWPHPTCIRVLITSKGVFPKTLAAPAITPNTPVTSGFMGLLGLSPGCGQGERKVKGPALSIGGGAWTRAYEGGGWGGTLAGRLQSVWRWVLWAETHAPRYQLRREVMTKKRMAWLDPCFNTVAVRPWYVPFSPRDSRHGVTLAHKLQLRAWGKLHVGAPRQEGEVQVLSILAGVSDPT